MTQRRLRIIHTEASMGWGGQEIRVLSESRKFQDEGHAVQLLCDPDSDIFKAAPDFDVARRAIPMKGKSFAGLVALRRCLREWRPDVVTTHSSVDHWLAAVARIGLAASPGIVRTRHISARVSRNLPTRWLYNKGADAVMTTSRSIVQDLTSDGFIPVDRVRSVPTGIDTNLFVPGGHEGPRARLGLPKDCFLFTIVATLRSWKGHSFLLQALASPPLADAFLVIVGDGPQEKNLRAQIAELRLENRVTIAGRQSAVVDYLQSADAFVLSSYANEGVPQAMLQAMACELPIVATPVGGIPELAEGLTAVLFAKERSGESLADAMVRVMKERPEPRALAALRARVEQHYSTDSMYRAALETYEAVI